MSRSLLACLVFSGKIGPPKPEGIMIRVALYARYSSDQQREASIEDQLRLCRIHAEKQGWLVADSYHDWAVSGASLIRPGIQAVLADALLADALRPLPGGAGGGPRSHQPRPGGCRRRVQAHGVRWRKDHHVVRGRDHALRTRGDS